jgi:hypothetical protein
MSHFRDSIIVEGDEVQIFEKKLPVDLAWTWVHFAKKWTSEL